MNGIYCVIIMPNYFYCSAAKTSFLAFQLPNGKVCNLLNSNATTINSAFEYANFQSIEHKHALVVEFRVSC